MPTDANEDETGPLTTEELVDLEKQYAHIEPRPCRVCGGLNDSISSVGMDKITFRCRKAADREDGKPMDWDHYGQSEQTYRCGDSHVLRLVAEVRRLRELLGQLEAQKAKP